MNRLLIFFCFLFFSSLSAQNLSKDTIQLSDVWIEKNDKKPKIKKIKIGTYDLTRTDNILFFTEDPVYYFVDSLPEGKLQNITLFFSEASIDPKIGFIDSQTFKIEKTEFEVTLFEIGDDYKVGPKINSEPIHINLPETKSYRVKKIVLDVAPYNIITKRFYIYLNKKTKTNCEKCYYYAPVLYKTPDGYHYIYNNNNRVYAKPDKACVFCYGLQMIVKTLTQDY
ncbi:hypothetical protein [Flavobacterium sp. NRK1]|uniref:hypothetical protein n=1 Tax=Flavobacterium sp. NRK1 TaxID=2954929 RepID=UPI002092BA57|nr:hypothetical protein [Flavobacterium sp. NRK1]MCO6147225.1 hypothetical protein [Flavobacterium sp. NRK1]